MTDEITRIRISLAHTRPEIWRVVDVPVDLNLQTLHGVMEAAMGWLDAHLWHFDDGERYYGTPYPDDPDDNLVAAKNVKLRTLIERGVLELVYLYDMGDSWEHVLTLGPVAAGESDIDYPRFVSGERRGPPEDVGGAPGFEQFLKVIKNRKHPEHEDAMNWYVEGYGEPFDPVVFDERLAPVQIGHIAKRRVAGKLSHATRKAR